MKWHYLIYEEAAMYLLPAIDILGGKAVRLAKGDYNQVTV